VTRSKLKKFQHFQEGPGSNPRVGDRSECTVSGSNENAARPVVLQTRGFRLVSRLQHEFLNPKINVVEPNRGQVGGGNTIKIYGENLDTGCKARVYINNALCEVKR